MDNMVQKDYFTIIKWFFQIGNKISNKAQQYYQWWIDGSFKIK